MLYICYIYIRFYILSLSSFSILVQTLTIIAFFTMAKKKNS